MKSATLLMVFYIIIGLVLCHVQVDVEAQTLKKCGGAQLFGGTCGFNGNKVCIGDYHGIGKTASGCRCHNDLHDKHLCICRVC
nr:S-locus cysteine-rich protein haplogroup B [Arabidopsis halleri]WNT94718.1 mutant S-locus cysteine-rich protein haplogroup B [Arabidopsis kamchatica]